MSADDVAARFRHPPHRRAGPARAARRGRAPHRLVRAALGPVGPGSGTAREALRRAAGDERDRVPAAPLRPAASGTCVDAHPEEEREIALARAGRRVRRATSPRRPASARTEGIRSAAERACAALGKLGFQASVTESTEDSVTITTPTCPLRPLVVANPEAAIVDRGMWMGLVDAYLPRSRPCSVSCETRGCLDSHASCRVLAQVRDRQSKYHPALVRSRGTRPVQLVPLPDRRRRHDRRRRLQGHPRARRRRLDRARRRRAAPALQAAAADEGALEGRGRELDLARHRRARRRPAPRPARSSRSTSDARTATDDAGRRRTATSGCCSRPAAGRGGSPAAATTSSTSARSTTTGSCAAARRGRRALRRGRRRLHRLGDRRGAARRTAATVTMVFPDAGIGARLFPADLSRVRHRLLPREGRRGARRRDASRPSSGTVRRRRHRARGRRRRRRARHRARTPSSPRRPGSRSTTASSSTSSAAPAGATTCSRPATSPASRSPRSAHAMRVEHEDHANSHGRAVGANMAGAGTPYDHLPFFYSDLFDLGYEAVGELDSRHATVEHVEGAEPQGRRRLRGRRDRAARLPALGRLGQGRRRARADRPRAVDEARLATR